MEERILPIAFSPDDLFCVNSESRAVWPIRSREDHQALAQITELFGAEMKEVNSQPGKTRAGLEDVVGLGEDVEDAARLYAHLTNRRFRPAINLDALMLQGVPTVIVTQSSSLKSELMEFLYEPRRNGWATGIIAASTTEGLYRQVLVRAAAAVLRVPTKTIRIDFSPELPISRTVADGQEVLGGKASADEIKAALGRGADLLTAYTHSDGIDAYLGPELTLCPMGFNPVEADEMLSPRCIVTGMCHRLANTTVKAGLRSGAFLSPHALSARIFIWNTCYGLLPPDGMVDPAWGLGSRLIESASIGALITTWEISITEDGHTEKLSRDLMRGIPCGDALARFNRSQDSRRFGSHRLCLIGDPRVQLMAQMSGGLKRSFSEAPHRVQLQTLRRDSASHHIKPTKLSDLTFKFNRGRTSLLRECLSLLVSEASDKQFLTERETLGSIRDYDRAAQLQEPLEDVANAVGQTMRSAILKCVFKRGKLFDVWMPVANNYKSLKPSHRCFVCGKKTNTTIAHFPLPQWSSRRISICPRCGVIDDSPHNSQFTFSLSDTGVVRLKGSLPAKHWKGGVLLGCPGVADNVGWEWPALANARPERMFSIPDKWPPGLVRVSIVMLWRDQFAIVTLPARSPIRR